MGQHQALLVRGAGGGGAACPARHLGAPPQLVAALVRAAVTEQAETRALAGGERAPQGRGGAAEEHHINDGWGLVLLSYSLVCLILVGIWAERRHVPSSLAAVAIGALLGLVLRVVGAESAPALHSMLFFDGEIFLYALLPPIIFEAGFSISRGFFLNNLTTILIFAIQMKFPGEES